MTPWNRVPAFSPAGKRTPIPGVFASSTKVARECKGAGELHGLSLSISRLDVDDIN